MSLKKTFIALFFFITVAITSHGQVFVKGTKMLSAGIGLGDRYLILSGYNMVVPPLQLNFDYGITEKLGIGYIGVGGLLSYSVNRYDYSNSIFNYNYRYTYTNITIASRATYHFDLGIEKVDLYAGAILGFNIASRSETYTGNGIPASNFSLDPPGNGGLVVGPFAGARYMFNEHFGAYSELGYTVSIFTLGLTYKF